MSCRYRGKEVTRAIQGPARQATDPALYQRNNDSVIEPLQVHLQPSPLLEQFCLLGLVFNLFFFFVALVNARWRLPEAAFPG